MARSGGMSHLFMGMMLQSMFGHDSNVIGVVPTSAWFALSTTPVTSSDSVSEPSTVVYLDSTGARTGSVTEWVESSGYARVEVPLSNSMWWSESGSSAVVNGEEIRFPTAAYGWGRIIYWAMMDRYEQGRLLAYGALRRPIQVLPGDIPIIAPGGVHFALDSYEREW